MSRNILNGWLWKQAEQMADDPSIEPEYSEMGFAMLPHFRRDKVKAAYIKRGECGGWIGDIVLKHMPPGCPDVLGTAVSHPAKSEAEARKAIIAILALVIRAERMDHRGNPGNPVFPFHDLLVPLSTEVMLRLNDEFPEESLDQYDFSLGRLADMEELFGGDYSSQKAASFDMETQNTFLTVIHIARHRGVVRWPETQAASPSGHHYESAMVH